MVKNMHIYIYPPDRSLAHLRCYVDRASSIRGRKEVASCVRVNPESLRGVCRVEHAEELAGEEMLALLNADTRKREYADTQKS